MKKAITPLITIAVLLGLVILGAAAFMEFYNKAVNQQKAQVEKHTINANVYAPIRIILSSEKVNRMGEVEFAVNLTPYKDIIADYNGRFKICADEVCATQYYYYCWQTPDGECTDKFDKNWNQYIIWVKADLRTNPEILYIVFGKGVSLTTGNNIFVVYDSFDGDALDATKWSYIDNGNCTYTVSNGILTIQSANNTLCGITTNQIFDTRNYPYLVFEANVSATASTSGKQFNVIVKYGSNSLSGGFIATADGSKHFIAVGTQQTTGNKLLDTNYAIFSLDPIFYGDVLYYKSDYEGETIYTQSQVILPTQYNISLDVQDDEATPTVALNVNWIRIYHTIPDLVVKVERVR